MNKLVIVVLAAVICLATCEPPSSYGAPSQPLYSIDDSSSDGDVVDSALLARIAQILSESGSSSSGGYSAPQYSAPPQSSYGPPQNSYSAPSSGYGAPARSSGIELGRIERAQLISEFELQDNNGGYGAPVSRGGY